MYLLTVSTLLTGLSPANQVPSAPRYYLEVKETRRVHAVLRYHLECPKIKAKQWRIYIARPPELSGQTNIKTRIQPVGSHMQEVSPLRRWIKEVSIPAKKENNSKGVQLEVTYQASLISRQLKRLAHGQKPPPVQPLTAKERQSTLLSYGCMDFCKDAVQQWLFNNNLHRRQGECEVDFARRVFSRIRSQFKYDFAPKMNRYASNVCQAGKSDCSGLTVLFVSALRANGVPARALYGRWARSSKADDKINGFTYHQQHVCAEFYARGVGWVPVDVASGIVHDQSRIGLTHFGTNNGNFFTNHVDSDLVIRVDGFGQRSVHALQRPAFLVSGSGSLDPTNLNVNWEVKLVK